MNVAFLALALVSGTTDSQPLVLVDNANPCCSIVTPDDATPTVNHAAKELAAYLKRISGAEVPIVGEGRFDSGTRIDVGLTGRVRANLPDGFLDEEERVLVRSDSTGVVICGGSDRGTLFAVYRFLELLGCRWLTPDPEDEIVPRQSKLVVKDLQLDTTPAFQWRLFKGVAASLEPWGVKVGFNGFYTPEAALDNGTCNYYPAGFSSSHTWYKLIANRFLQQ